MNQVQLTARRALRRMALNRFVAAAGVALTIGGVAAVAAVVTDRLLALELNNWLLVGAPMGLGLIGAGVAALMTPRNLLCAAADIDRALSLQDRLGTGLALRDAKDDPFAAIAIADAEAVAAQVRVSRATPVRFGASWWVWPIALSAAVAGAIFLPVFDIVNRQAEATREASAVAERERAVEELVDARKAIAPDNIATEDLATPSELAVLEDLEKQLAAGEVDPDEARAKAASALSETAQQMERAAKAREEQLDALREELKGVDGGEGAPESSPLAKALSRGDFEEAQRLIEQHRQSLDQLEQQERDRIAQRRGRRRGGNATVLTV